MQGQVANLTSEEICKEIIKRNSNNVLNKVDENEFNDPEPEVNLNASQSLSSLKDFDDRNNNLDDELDDVINKKKNNNKIGKHKKKRKIIISFH